MSKRKVKDFKMVCEFCGKDALTKKHEDYIEYIINKPCKNCGLQSYVIEEATE